MFKLNRRSFLASSATVTLAACQTVPGKGGGKGPNILVICSDQQHWRALGCLDDFFHTPNLDALAAESTLFTHAHCTTPQCSPSRASIYTGRYPHRTGVIGNLGSIDHQGVPIPGLPVGTETVASRLRSAGYHTAYFGKWHLGNRAYFATHFDESALDFHGDGAISELALGYLERCAAADKPFALFVNYVNPHDIYDVNGALKAAGDHADMPGVPLPASWADDLSSKPAPQAQFMKEDQGAFIVDKGPGAWRLYRDFYREKCRLVDIEAGRVLDRLAALGLKESTVVVYTADHGDMDTNHRLVFKGPFMYEHLVRVPLLVRLPRAFGGRAPGKADALVTLADLAPTLCELASAPVGKVDGTSLLPLLTGQGDVVARDFVVSQYYNKQRWVNPIRMIRTAAFKYNRYLDFDDELYDLRRDPDEMNNLAGHAETAARQRALGERLAEWMARHGDTAFHAAWSTGRDGTRLDAG